MDTSLEKVSDATLASLRAAAVAHYAALVVSQKSSSMVARIIAATMDRKPVDIDEIAKDAEPKPARARAYLTESYDLVISFLPPSSPFIEPLTKLRDEAVARITG